MQFLIYAVLAMEVIWLGLTFVTKKAWNVNLDWGNLRKKYWSNFYWDDFQPQKWPPNWAQGFDSSIVFHALKWPDFQAPHQSKVDGCQAKKIPKHLRVCQDSRKLQSVLIKQTCLVPRMNNWGCKEKTALLHHHHFAKRKSVFELITFIFEIELLVGK